MRIVDRIRTSIGATAVAGMLALASPGVSVVHAEESAQDGEAAAGPVCEAGQPFQGDAQIQAYLEQLRRSHEVSVEIDGEGPVALNNRGYNYGPAPGIDTGRVLIDAQGQH